MRQIRRHPLGYGELWPRPTRAELREYYASRYYSVGHPSNPYEPSYSEEEKEHKRLAAREVRAIVGVARGDVLDVGCGEGFVLADFAETGWSVRGVDFTVDAVATHFPHLVDRVEAADVFDWLDRAVAAGVEADVVIANHVLEHVLEPGLFLEQVRRLVRPGGLCRIVVPNDGSWLQHLVVARGDAEHEFWKVDPDHLSYFDAPALRSTLEYHGLEVVELLGEFPVDLFLLHPFSNYQRQPKAGRLAHLARIAFETQVARRSIDELISFRRGCAAAGIGRNLVAYCRPAWR